MFGTWNGQVFPVPLKLEWPKQPDVPEWERRPFALSPPEYYTQSYPGTTRAKVLRRFQEMQEHAESEKEKAG
jgi:hypothetical protein